MKLQRPGGYAAIAGVCCFIIFLIMGDLIMGGLSPDNLLHAEKMMAALSAKLAHVVALFLSYSIGYILTFVMFLALHERMQADAVHLTRIMLIAASASIAVAITGSIVLLMGGGMVIVPAQDVSAFRALWAIVLGLRMMGHHTYGWACLLTGCAILKTRSFSRILGWLSLFAGIVWIPTTIVLQLLRVSQFLAILIIAVILSFLAQVWIGVALLRQKQPQPALKEMAASS
jgi:hypothetical protein